MEYKKQIVKEILNKLRSEYKKTSDDYFNKEIQSIRESKDVLASMQNIVAKWMDLAEMQLGDAITEIERKHNVENKKIKQ